MSSASNKPPRPDVPRNLKPYFLCLLKKGPKWNVTEGHEDLMPQYLAYLRRETERRGRETEGRETERRETGARRIVFAGPVTDEGETIGVAVLEAASAEEARAMVGENPAVKSGHFIAELHPCFLPALDGVSVEY